MDKRKHISTYLEYKHHFSHYLTRISCLVHGNGQLDDIVNSLGILGFLWLLAYNLLLYQEAESFWRIHARPTIPLDNMKKTTGEWG